MSTVLRCFVIYIQNYRLKTGNFVRLRCSFSLSQVHSGDRTVSIDSLEDATVHLKPLSSGKQVRRGTQRTMCARIGSARPGSLGGGVGFDRFDHSLSQTGKALDL